MSDRFDAAKRYYYVIVRKYLLATGERFCPEDAINSWMQQIYRGATLIAPSKEQTNRIFIRLTILDFVKNHWVDYIPDEFAPHFVRGNANLRDAPMQDPRFLAISNKYDAFGEAGDDW